MDDVNIMKKERNFVTPFEEFGCEVCDGWLDICDRVKERIRQYNEAHHDNPIEIFQIKSKFGELRVYLMETNTEEDRTPEELRPFIREMEKEALETCEWCGSKKEVRTFSYKGWIRTLCDSCEKELKERNERKEI
jgi:hypothetical protein